MLALAFGLRGGGRWMKKIGDFWLPDVDVRWGKQRRKSIRLFENGRGSKPGDLEEALGCLTKWTVAVDGGANVGAYTRILMERFEVIHAFEPAPDTYAALARNVEEWGGSGQVHTSQVALSDRLRRSASRGVQLRSRPSLGDQRVERDRLKPRS